MRTIEQLHEAVKEIVGKHPNGVIQVCAGEMVSIINATEDAVRETANVPRTTRMFHMQYANSRQHHPDIRLTVAANKLLALTSLVTLQIEVAG